MNDEITEATRIPPPPIKVLPLLESTYDILKPTEYFNRLAETESHSSFKLTEEESDMLCKVDIAMNSVLYDYLSRSKFDLYEIMHANVLQGGFTEYHSMEYTFGLIDEELQDTDTFRRAAARYKDNKEPMFKFDFIRSMTGQDLLVIIINKVFINANRVCIHQFTRQLYAMLVKEIGVTKTLTVLGSAPLNSLV